MGSQKLAAANQKKSLQNQNCLWYLAMDLMCLNVNNVNKATCTLYYYYYYNHHQEFWMNCRSEIFVIYFSYWIATVFWLIFKVFPWQKILLLNFFCCTVLPVHWIQMTIKWNVNSICYFLGNLNFFLKTYTFKVFLILTSVPLVKYIYIYI